MCSVRVAAENHVPYEVQAALVDATGKVFWYWNDYRRYLHKAGVNQATVMRLTAGGVSKYEVMRRLLDELDGAGAAGRQVQLQLVEAMVGLRVPAVDGVEPGDAKAAQASLRTVADEHGLLPETKAAAQRAEETLAAKQRREQAAARARARESGAQHRQALFAEYCALLKHTDDTQARGYRLEEMLGEAAELDGLRYHPPYRKGSVVQTDGMVGFEGFQYLIEARWRMDPPNVAAVAALAHKASRSLQSTRALFVSVEGFRPAVVTELETGVKNVLLMSGDDLSLILEGRMTVGQALQLKVEEGAKKGRIFYDLRAKGWT